jgi:hypothetical protein
MHEALLTARQNYSYWVADLLPKQMQMHKSIDSADVLRNHKLFMHGATYKINMYVMRIKPSVFMSLF